MKISQNCLDLIKKWEGLKLDAYIDPVGIPTIGFGTIRYPNGKEVRLGDKISDVEAEAFLKFEVDESIKSLEDFLKGVKLNQNQFDAIVSLSYNIGVGAFAGSTLLKKLKTDDLKGAATEFDRWNKGTINGVKQALPGLTNRRKDERGLFEKGGKGGTPIDVEASPQDEVTWLEGFRDGDDQVIVARAGKSKVVEILVLKGNLKEDIIAILRQYKNAAEFKFAPADKAIPKGERIEIANKSKDIAKVEDAPTLERSLLILGVRDDEPGVTGSDVKELQQRLSELGYYENENDGIFGKATDDAVRSFQADFFSVAEADGRVGKITWSALWGKEAKKVPVEGTFVAGKNYLLLTKTPTKDPSGLFKLKLQYFKDGQSQDFIMTNSGQPKRQFFRKGKDSISGSFEPLPEGKWSIHDILWAGGKDIYDKTVWKAGLGPAKINLDYVPKNGTKRSFIQIHIDWNNKTSPGTAGCIGVYNVADFKKLVTWLRDTDPRDLYVDWGLGSVKTP